MNIDFQVLKQKGWTVIPFKGDILQFARGLGKPVPNRRDGTLIDRLMVVDPKDAKPNSLSSRYGKGAFPFHTDGAHHREVPRFLLMRLAAGGSTKRPTLLKDILLIATDEEKRILQEDLWIISDGHHHFLSPIYFKNDAGEEEIRFDGDCMKPSQQRNKSSVIINDLINKASTSVIVWESDNLLILDNRRLLHTRAAHIEGDDDSHRILERVLVL